MGCCFENFMLQLVPKELFPSGSDHEICGGFADCIAKISMFLTIGWAPGNLG